MLPSLSALTSRRPRITHQGVRYEMPRRLSDQASVVTMALPKSGSIMMYTMLARAARHVGLRYVALPELFERQGIPPNEIPPEASELFDGHGYLYGGFRNAPRISVPILDQCRSLLLVRDPRDLITSHYFSLAFSHPAPQGDAARAAFEARRAKVRSQSIDAFALDQAPVIATQFKRLEELLPRADVFRYEDIVFRKADWLADVASAFGWSLQMARCQQIAAPLDIVPGTEDPNAHIRKVTPGDHRDKLAPATVEALDEVLAPVLERYGYGSS